jgi:clan AA aspartic protease
LDLTWKYSDEHRPSAPVLKASVREFTVELQIDTGFSGGILLPFQTFQSIGLASRLSPESFAAVLPDARRVPVYTAVSDVTIGSLKLSSRIHSSPLLNKRLIGREALRSMVARLDGPKETLTVLKGSQ